LSAQDEVARRHGTAHGLADDVLAVDRRAEQN